ncbi:MAG: long-chain fatty acid--CoA ligase [Sphingomonas bacterium]|uniref:class I adenylate-forming enzyme family protein n=1 Tax=Sphingomonas bacterium TaxID=1895847 RepID=UPI0026300880|nr:fatty acid--CoA ligase family protein [Sphingomonas bacterium]MDB5712036.1 long-chain fatty acid--CoA ligase [Sphingomonas bacterium]
MADVGTTIAEVLAIDPAADVIAFGDDWWSWGTLAARLDELSALYDERGLGEGARIGVMLRNRPPQLAALLSCVADGRCLVTLNPLYPDAAMVADLAALDLPVLVAGEEDLDRPGISEAARNAGTALIALSPTGATLRDPGDPSRWARPVSAETIIEMLTSGTTGKPKRVALGRTAFQHSFDAALAYEGGRDTVARLRSGTQVLAAPLTHIGGVWGAINAVAAGRKLALLERFKVEDWRRAVVTHRPRVAGVTAAGLRMILDADVPPADLASLSVLTAGAAPVPPDVIDAFLARYDLPVLVNYGATEFAGPVAGWSLADFRAHYPAKRGSAGRIQRGVEARIVDPASGAVLAAGQPGVLELRAPQLGDATAWLRTTDLAALDDDGFLTVLGRADHAIIRGGFKIQPEDVARALEAHPAVREAIVVGLADERLGQVPAAAVMLRSDGAGTSCAELDVHLRQLLLPYQVPALIAIVDDVPRSASLKPILPEVVALLAAEQQSDKKLTV